jgi:hypothetical protein
MRRQVKKQENVNADRANEIRLWEKHFDENKNPPATVQPSIKANEFTKIISKLAKVELTNKLLENTCKNIKALFERNNEDSKPAAITNKKPKHTVSDDSNGSN